MKFKNRSNKIRKNCNNQLTLEFDNTYNIEFYIRTPKITPDISTNQSTQPQKFTIKLCEG